MLEQLNNHEWKCVFEFIEDYNIHPVFGSEKINLSTFDREAVVEIIGMDKGVPDEKCWILVGKLIDGRWFLICTWCDYSIKYPDYGNIYFSFTKEDIIQYGMTDFDRERTGLKISSESCCAKKEYKEPLGGENFDYTPCETLVSSRQRIESLSAKNNEMVDFVDELKEDIRNLNNDYAELKKERDHFKKILDTISVAIKKS